MSVTVSMPKSCGSPRRTWSQTRGLLVPIEQPTTIVTPPLSVKDRDDRIRAVFGLTHDDLIPQVNPETLLIYFRYLRATLTFPFPATYWDFGRLHDQKITVMIHGLPDPEEIGFDEEDGLICHGRDQNGRIEIPLAEIELKKKGTQPLSRSLTTPTGSITGGEFDSNPARAGTVPLPKRGW